MVRTQVYFTREQHSALRRAAERSGVSMTEELRRLIDRHLLARRAPADFEKDAFLAFVGLGESGERDISERHDEVLDEALRDADLR